VLVSDRLAGFGGAADGADDDTPSGTVGALEVAGSDHVVSFPGP
jgi:hypothetical protein